MRKSSIIVSDTTIALHYFLKPLWISLALSISGALGLKVIKIAADDLLELAKIYLGIGVSFSLTFIAFSITALALLQLLHTKEWFIEVSKSVYFKSFLKRFMNSIIYCLILFIGTLAAYILLGLKNDTVISICVIAILFIMLYILSWTWSCITDFISLFK